MKNIEIEKNENFKTFIYNNSFYVFCYCARPGFSKNSNQDFYQKEDCNSVIKIIQNNSILIWNVVRASTSVNGRRHNHRNHQASKELTVPDTQKEIDKLSHNFSRLLYILSLKKLNPAKAGLRERNPLNGLTKLSPKYQKDNGKRYLKYYAPLNSLHKLPLRYSDKTAVPDIIIIWLLVSLENSRFAPTST